MTSPNTSKVLILLGPPGAGKGTQSRLLEQKFDLVQLSTGDLLRRSIESGSETGKAVESIMAEGRLVGDDIVISILRDRMRDSDCAGGVILDGFPRTLSQARALDQLLAETGQQISAVVSLAVDDKKMVDRISGRFTCAGCGEGYHDTFKPLEAAERCDNCGGSEFKRRADDKAETVAARLIEYREQTSPLIDYYSQMGVLANVDAMGPIEAINRSIEAAISSRS